MDVVKLGTCAVGGYATVGLAAYAVDQVGLAKWKLQQIEKNATTPVVKVADVFVRLLASIGLGWAANRFLKDKKCAAAVLVGGAFNAVHSAVEHFVLDTDAGRDLPAPIKGALAGYDGYAGLYSPAELEGVDGYQQAGVDGYQQGPRRLAGGMDGYQQAERSQRYAQAVAGAGY